MTVMLGQRYKQIIMITIFNEGTQLAMTGFSVALKISHKCHKSFTMIYRPTTMAITVGCTWRKL